MLDCSLQGLVYHARAAVIIYIFCTTGASIALAQDPVSQASGNTKWLSLDNKGMPRIAESERGIGRTLAADAILPKGNWTPKLNPVCGFNCLYIFLRLREVDIPREDLQGEVTQTGDGASMLELQEAANRRGVRAEVRQLVPSELSSLPLPLIARLQVGDKDGHFIVLTRIEEGHVGFIDGSSMRSVLARRDAFNDEFSGFVLVCPQSKLHIWTRWLLAGLSLALFSTTAMRVLKKQRVSRSSCD